MRFYQFWISSFGTLALGADPIQQWRQEFDKNGHKCDGFIDLALEGDGVYANAEAFRDLKIIPDHLQHESCANYRRYLERFGGILDGSPEHFSHKFQRIVKSREILTKALAEDVDIPAANRMVAAWSSPDDTSADEIKAIAGSLGIWFANPPYGDLSERCSDLESFFCQVLFKYIFEGNNVKRAFALKLAWKNEKLNALINATEAHLALFTDFEKRKSAASDLSLEDLAIEVSKFLHSRTWTVLDKLHSDLEWPVAFIGSFVAPADCAAILGQLQETAELSRLQADIASGNKEAMDNLACLLNTHEGFEERRKDTYGKLMVRLGFEQKAIDADKFIIEYLDKQDLKTRQALLGATKLLEEGDPDYKSIFETFLLQGKPDAELVDRYVSHDGDFKGICLNAWAKESRRVQDCFADESNCGALRDAIDGDVLLATALRCDTNLLSEQVARIVGLGTDSAAAIHNYRSARNPGECFKFTYATFSSSNGASFVNRIRLNIELKPSDADEEGQSSAKAFKDIAFAILDELPFETRIQIPDITHRVMTADIPDRQKGVMADILAFTHPTVEQLFYFHYTLEGSMDMIMNSVGQHFVSGDLRECMKQADSGQCEGAGLLAEKYPLVGLYFATDPKVVAERAGDALAHEEITGEKLQTFRERLVQFPDWREDGLFLLAGLSLANKDTKTPVTDLVSVAYKKPFWQFMEALIPVKANSDNLLAFLSTRTFTGKQFTMCKGATSIIARGFLSVPAINTIEFACAKKLTLLEALLEEARNELRQCVESPAACEGHAGLSPLQKVALMTDSEANIDQLSAFLHVGDSNKGHLVNLIQMVDRTNTAVVLLRALLGRRGDVNAVLADFADPPTQEIFAVFMRISGSIRAPFSIVYPNMLQAVSGSHDDSRLFNFLSRVSRTSMGEVYVAVAEASDRAFERALIQAWKAPLQPSITASSNMFVLFAALFNVLIPVDEILSSLSQLGLVKVDDNSARSVKWIRGLLVGHRGRYEALYEIMIYAGVRSQFKHFSMRSI